MGDDDKIKAWGMLSTLGRKPPSEVTLQELMKLAALCLCGNWHKGQAGKIASKWMDLVEALPPTPAEIPPLPSTPEKPKVPESPPFTINFGNPTPPSSQENLRPFSFTSPLGLPIRPPTFVFGANNNKAPTSLTSGDAQLAARLKEESSAKNQAKKELRDAQTKISNLTSEMNTLNIDLAKKELEKANAEDEPARVKQQLDALSSEKDSVVEKLEKDLAAQRQLTEDRDRELRAAEFQHATEITRLNQKATKGLEVQAQRYKALAEQAEKQKEAAQIKFSNLQQEARTKLTSASDGKRALSDEIRVSKGQLESATAHNSSLTARNDELAQDLRETQEALEAAGQRVFNLERELREERAKPVLATKGQEKQRDRNWLGRVSERLRGRRSESWV